ncbi:acyltransferase [Octadecabacter sp. CECT 8868]|uniref:acyltransferase family protein n=1 Tax=Octadecabacter algicola TaxID=2909342 RepID=UPI001F30559A|nr:acyltransferase [Octadecabacter algicola]MCF2906657.1 acyltransferase [Octadecabacter algicola]
MSDTDTTALNRSHLPDLDGFRGLSILAVLAAHMLPLGPKSWMLNSVAGHIGMSIFFALSGFLICRFLWEKQDVPTFFVRRIARIAPLVMLVSFIYCILLEGRVDSFIIINLYAQNYWTSALTPATSPFWSLAVEMHFYIAIGLAVLFFGRRGFWLLPIGAIIVLLFRIEAEVFSNINTHFRVDEILTGGMLALAWLNRDRPLIAKIMAALPYLFWPILILWLLSCWPPSGSLGYARAYLSALLIGSVLGMENRWQNVVLGTKFLAYIATISFAIYVWHSPFRHGWFDAGTDIERYFFKRPLAFACIFALAHVSTFYFEKPITMAAKRISIGRAKGTARPVP